MASLRSRIRGGESATVEYKIEAPEPERLARTIAAFANSAGGSIFIGISDRGDILGVSDPEAQKKLVKDALWYVDPPVDLKVETVVHEFKDVVAIDVPPARISRSFVVQHRTRSAALLPRRRRNPSARPHQRKRDHSPPPPRPRPPRCGQERPGNPRHPLARRSEVGTRLRQTPRTSRRTVCASSSRT